MRARLRGRPLAAVVSIGIGHNNGPPMATRWGLHCWKRAHARAWQAPAPEVVKLRLRRAGELGLGYRQLASVVMESGQAPAAIVFALDGTLVDATLVGATPVDATPAGFGRPLAGVVEKLCALARPKLFVIADGRGAGGRADALVAALRAGGVGILEVAAAADEAGRAAAVLALLSRHRVSPKATILVGSSEADRAVATRARLAAYVTAAAYFGHPADLQPPTGPSR